MKKINYVLDIEKLKKCNLKEIEHILMVVYFYYLIKDNQI